MGLRKERSVSSGAGRAHAYTVSGRELLARAPPNQVQMGTWHYSPDALSSLAASLQERVPPKGVRKDFSASTVRRVTPGRRRGVLQGA